QSTEAARRLAEAQTREFKSVLDAAADGVVVIDPVGRIASASRSAATLFSYDAVELARRTFADLFAPESRATALDYLAEVARAGIGGQMLAGRELTGETQQGGAIALFMTLGRIGDDGQHICVAFRDLGPWKQAERDLVAAREAAEKASAAKSSFLAKIS